jgi:hypothetical protein
MFWMTFSNSFPVVDKRLIGHKFCGNLGSLPGFGKVINFASFQALDNGYINALNEPRVSLEGAWDIRSKRH